MNIWDPFNKLLPWVVVIKCIKGESRIFRTWEKGDFIFKEVNITFCPFVDKCKKRKVCSEKRPCKGIIEKAYALYPPRQKSETEKLLEKMKYNE